MIKDINKLPNDPQTLKAMLLQLQGELDASNEKVEYLLEQFRLAQQKRFGASSEAHPGQGELFNEAEVEDDKIEVVEQQISYTRRQPKRQKLPTDLPRDVIIHDISDEDKICDCCGEELHQMGESRSEKLEFIPAQIKVIEHVRLKYCCRGCDKHGIKNKVKIAQLQRVQSLKVSPLLACLVKLLPVNINMGYHFTDKSRCLNNMASLSAGKR